MKQIPSGTACGWARGCEFCCKYLWQGWGLHCVLVPGCLLSCSDKHTHLLICVTQPREAVPGNSHLQGPVSSRVSGMPGRDVKNRYPTSGILWPNPVRC